MADPTLLNTVDRVIRLAYRDAGLIQEGDDPNAYQVSDGLARLTDLINIIQVDTGQKLWTLADISIPLVAGTSSYTLGPSGSVNMIKPLRIVQAYYRDANGIRRPLVMLSREEWTRLSILTQTGQINSYFVDKQLTNLTVNVWLVPDATAATGTMHVVTQQQIDGPSDVNAQTQFPPEWFIALRWGLADDLATGQPDAIMAQCSNKFQQYKDILENWDVEDAPVTFTPDQRSMYGYSSFR